MLTSGSVGEEIGGDFMIQISCSDVKKYYGAELVLHGVSIEVQEGERVAVVGPNGCGKSTLLKILCKMEDCEEGSVAIRKGAVVGYLEQNPSYKEKATVKDVLNLAFQEVFSCKEELRELEQQLSKNQGEMEEVLRKYSICLERYEQLGGYALEERYSRVYQGLQIQEELLMKPFALLSGGEKTLVCLAKVLLMNPEILILDEPTNHLDMSMLSWLETYLQGYRGSVIFVSHDRYFLSRVATKVVDMERGTAVAYPYPYDTYVEQKKKRREELEAQYKEQQKQIHKMEQAIKRMRIWAAQADNEMMFQRAASMQKRLDRMDKVEKPISVNYQAQLDFGMSERSGKDVLQVENLSKSFGDKRLLTDAKLCIYYQEHVAMIGENGCGKSTFIKMLLGEELPDEGEIKIGSSLKIAYLPQKVTFAHEDWTVLETYREDANLSEGKARELLARHLFTKDTVFKKVQNLSGGERSRLKFAMLMLREINFLILDEPTNHLDIPSRERLEEALLEFKGTILMISHDRFFINRLASRVVEFTEGQLCSYPGSFDDYLVEKEKQSKREMLYGKEQDEKGLVGKKQLDKKQMDKEPIGKEETGKEEIGKEQIGMEHIQKVQYGNSQSNRSTICDRATQKNKPQEEKVAPRKSKYSLQFNIERVEQEIEALEAQQRQLNEEYEEAALDYTRLAKLEEERKLLEKSLDEKMTEWTQLSSSLEEVW